MKETACGIICEYNPFHNGHRYQLEQVREQLGLPAVCAMSGSFVQRGEPACADKTFRAQTAVVHGACVVLEIPFPYSCLSAERFAAAGVRILAGSGMCSHLAFGSECADIGALTEIAAALCDAGVQKSIQVYQKEHPASGYARAREAVLRQTLGDTLAEISTHPNDILAIEYIKAIRQSQASLVPVAFRRSCGRSDAPRGSFASSSDIRALFEAGQAEQAAAYMPQGICLPYTRRDGFYKALHLMLMLKTPEELRGICEIGGGFEHAVVKTARDSRSYGELFARLRCKTLTDAKIRRMLLFAALGVTTKDAAEPVAYTSVLAAAQTEQAIHLLRTARRNKTIILARRVSAVRADAAANRQYEKNDLAERVLGAADLEGADAPTV